MEAILKSKFNVGDRVVTIANNSLVEFTVDHISFSRYEYADEKKSFDSIFYYDEQGTCFVEQSLALKEAGK